MKRPFKYNRNRFDEFDIIRHQQFTKHEDFRSYDRNRFLNMVDGLIGSGELNDRLIPFDNSLHQYKYYLMRHMKNVEKWYKYDSFSLYCTNCKGKSNRILFVKNNKNEFLDNIIFKDILTDIDQRIKNNCYIYTVNTHALLRSKFRLPEVYNYSNDYDIINYLIDKVNNETRPTELKEQYLAYALLKHNWEKANYYKDKDGNIYVVHDHVLLTVHGNESEWFK